jgi:hypothetical protein
MSLPPSPADFEAALRRIERGLATIDDAILIREYVGEIEDALDYFREGLRQERESNAIFARAMNQALNEGSGVYRP